jgi:hypothetical protein
MLVFVKSLCNLALAKKCAPGHFIDALFECHQGQITMHYPASAFYL